MEISPLLRLPVNDAFSPLVNAQRYSPCADFEMRAAEVKPYTMHVKVVDLFCPLISLQI
jgi:hypothetical protein